MSGRYSPLHCCDRDCAIANGCTVGGCQCAGCGQWFCGNDLDEDGYCDDCAERRREEEEEEDNEESESEGEDNG